MTHEKTKLLLFEAVSLAAGEYGVAEKEAELLVREEQLERRQKRKKLRELA